MLNPERIKKKSTASTFSSEIKFNILKMYRRHTIAAGLFYISFTGVIVSQEYKVGVPINKYVAAYETKANSSICYPNSYEKVSFPYNTITGVNTILIFDSVSVSNSIYVNPGHKIVNSGDTLFISASSYKYDFYFPAKAYVKGKIFVIGTPENEGETYNCSDIEIEVLSRYCNTPVSYKYKDEKKCVIERVK